MSPAASVEFRVPGNHQEQSQPSSSPYCEYPVNPSNPSFSKVECNNASGAGIGSEQCGGLFNSGRSFAGSASNGRVQEVRLKPRFVKVRKGISSRSSRSSSSISVDPGINPFQSRSRSSDQLKDDSGRANGFPSSTKAKATSGESQNFGFVFGENISLEDTTSNLNNTDTKVRGGNFDRIGNAFVPATFDTNCPTGEIGVTAGQHRGSDAESLHGGDHSLSGSIFGNWEPCNEKKVETDGKRESFKFDKTSFIMFGSGWAEGSMKREGQVAASSSEVSSEQGKGGQFRNFVKSSFVFGAGSSNLGLDSTNCVGKWSSDNQQASSGVNQASFVFAAGELTTSSNINPGEKEGGFSASFIDSSSNVGMKENMTQHYEGHGKKDSIPGDHGNHAVGNYHLGNKESSNIMGHSFPFDKQNTEAEIGSRCQFDNGRSTSSNEGQENNYFVYRSSKESYSSHNTEEAKMSNEVGMKSSAYQCSTSGDGCSVMSSIGKSSDAKLSEEMKKLNINNLQKAVHAENAHFLSTGAPTNVNGTFVFKSCRPDSTYSTGTMSTSDKMDKMKASGNKKGIDVERDNGASVRSADDRPSVFGISTSSSSSSSGVSSHCSTKCQFSESAASNGKIFNGDMDPSSFPSFGLGTTAKCRYATSEERREMEPMGTGSFGMELKVPQSDAFSFSGNMYNTLDRKSEHGLKTRDRKSKKIKGKVKRHDFSKQKSRHETESGKSSPHIESTECYSPMDFSPYEESTVTEQCSPEGSVKFNLPPFAEINYTPSGKSHISTNSDDANFAAAYADSESKPFSVVDVASGDAGTGVYSHSSHKQNDGPPFQFASDSGTRTEQFKFTASASAQDHPLPIKRQPKKYRMKVRHAPPSTSAVRGSSLGNTAMLTDKKQVANGVISGSKMRMSGEETSTSTLSAAEEACEKWRLRGNQAYKSGELYKAEDFYTWGINCRPSGEASGLSVKPLALCYSNRAATRMALGRVRDALQDCLVAATLDPGFLKAEIRAANCHLMMGELEEAMQNFNKCMKSGAIICLDRQLVIAASDGLQRAQKVLECSQHAEELLKLQTSEAAFTALESIAEGLSISLYSEKLLKLKAEALCLLQKYEDAIQVCERTLDFAEKNFPLISSQNCNVNGSDGKTNINARLWRSRILAKCYFHLGRLEAALGVLEKHASGRNSQVSDPLVVTIIELLKHKNAGNEAFRSGKHTEAVEHYTSAISYSIESRPFAAVCFCNRAAAYQVLGQIADAISDCSVAIALDENYVKAVSRRASLHEKIRDYKQAVCDLQKLVSILEKQSPGKANQSGCSNEKELKQAYQRLSLMEEQSEKDISLDLYLILGIKQADTASEIKKAYRKLALKHHPDKAGQSLVRSESGDDGRLWKEIADMVQKDSDRLFKMIGEAYAVLSDPEKRAEYDMKENMRSASRASDVNRGSSRRETDFYSYTYSYPFERSTNRRQWQGGYRSRNS